MLLVTLPVRLSTRCLDVEGRKDRLSWPSLVLLILDRLMQELLILAKHMHRLLTLVLLSLDRLMLALLTLGPLLIDC